MSNIIWIYYVVVAGTSINLERFNSFEACENHMHQQYLTLKQSFRNQNKQLTGSGCKRDLSGY